MIQFVLFHLQEHMPREDQAEIAAYDYTDWQNDTTSLPCYELFKDAQDKLSNFEFWVSGVILFIIGVLGEL